LNCGPVARFCAILCTANSRNHPQLEARFPGSVNTTETAVNGERGGSNRPVPNGPVLRHSNVPALVRAPGHLRGNFCTTAPDSQRRERDSYRRDRPSGIGARKSSVFLAIGSSIDGADDAVARFIPPSWETTQRHNINSSSAERTAAKTRRSSRSPNT